MHSPAFTTLSINGVVFMDVISLGDADIRKTTESPNCDHPAPVCF